MYYLSGAVRPEIEHPNLGWMVTPLMGNRVGNGRVWAADTGNFTRPDLYDTPRYLSWLQSMPLGSCLFATAPDVVGDADETWERSRDVLPLIRELGIPAALVAQDGLESVDWDSIDCLFIGGTTGWKLGWEAHRWVQEARERDKWAHVGRVNSWRRCAKASRWGCDSVDGTYLTFGPDTNTPKLLGWLDKL